MNDVPNQKKKFRQYLLDKRQQLSLEERTTFSQSILSYLHQFLTTKYTEEQTIQLLVYHALPAEVSTSALFGNTPYQVFVPRMLDAMDMEWIRVDGNTIWKQQAFGVLEPEMGERWQKNDLKTVLVAPLLGFDRLGNRLGMGKGYFDRWLSLHAKDLDMQLGLAFSCQELSKVPTEKHDAPLATIITEHGVISCPTN